MPSEQLRASLTSLALFVIMSAVVACSDPGTQPLTLQQIAVYPNATPAAEFSQPSFAGLMKGMLAQYTTDAPFAEVVAFYEHEMDAYNSESLAFRSELGRQHSFSIQQESGVITVAIQEFTSSGRVTITLMGIAQ